MAENFLKLMTDTKQQIQGQRIPKGQIPENLHQALSA